MDSQQVRRQRRRTSLLIASSSSRNRATEITHELFKNAAVPQRCRVDFAAALGINWAWSAGQNWRLLTRSLTVLPSVRAASFTAVFSTNKLQITESTTTTTCSTAAIDCDNLM